MSLDNKGYTLTSDCMVRSSEVFGEPDSTKAILVRRMCYTINVDAHFAATNVGEI